MAARNANHNSAWRRSVARVDVLLTCGHIIRIAVPPWNRHSKYRCDLGCGHSLSWVNCTDDGLVRTNRLHTQPEEEDRKK